MLKLVTSYGYIVIARAQMGWTPAYPPLYPLPFVVTRNNAFSFSITLARTLMII